MFNKIINKFKLINLNKVDCTLGSLQPQKNKIKEMELGLNERNRMIKRYYTRGREETQAYRRAIATMPHQNVEKYGLRALCVDKKMWDSFAIEENKLHFYELGIKYNKKPIVKVTDSYETVVRKLGPYCTCGKKNVEILNGIDIAYLKKINVYTQCPLLKLTCIRKVLSQFSLPDPMLSNDLLRFYKENYHSKFVEAAKELMYITPKALMKGIKNMKKQAELLPYYAKVKEMFKIEVKTTYKQHNKIELQEIGDKVRQICDPCTTDKFITMLFEKSLTAMMYKVFGMQYGVGLSTIEKAKEIEKELPGKWKITLDISGFDNSHNYYIKQSWDMMIDEVLRVNKGRFEKYIDADVVREQFCKYQSKVIYTMRLNKKEEKYCELNLGPRLASGSTYTTLLNTFLMVLCINYAASKLKVKEGNTSSTSGDDALVLINDKNSKKESVGCLYKVYGCKLTNFFNNLGIKLKYCLISKNTDDIVPCSLDTFECKKCGVKMVRHFFKYIKNTFLSEKYITNLLPMGIPIEYFEQLVYEGEMAWARGLKTAEMILSPLDHGLDIKQIALFIAEKLKKKSEANKKISVESMYAQKLLEMDIVNYNDKPTQIANKLLALLKDEKVPKTYDNIYCDYCTVAYDTFLYNKYGIIASEIAAFYTKDRWQFDIIENEMRERDCRYIPALLLERFEKYYAEKQKKINEVPSYDDLRQNYKENLEKYWTQKISTIPNEAFGDIRPKDMENKIEALTNMYMDIAKSEEDYFVQLFLPINRALLLMYYDVNNPDNVLKLESPVTEKEIYNKSNTYKKIVIERPGNKIELELIKPSFKLPEVKYNKSKKGKQLGEKEYNRLVKDIKGMREQMEYYIKNYKEIDTYYNSGNFMQNNDLPPVKYHQTDDLIVNRMYLMMATRFYEETNRQDYLDVKNKYEENKERILNQL